MKQMRVFEKTESSMMASAPVPQQLRGRLLEHRDARAARAPHVLGRITSVHTHRWSRQEVTNLNIVI